MATFTDQALQDMADGLARLREDIIVRGKRIDEAFANWQKVRAEQLASFNAAKDLHNEMRRKFQEQLRKLEPGTDYMTDWDTTGEDE